MKKEYLIIADIAMFILSYGIDMASEVNNLPIRQPYSFLEPRVLAVFPFTAVSIGLKTVGFTLGMMLLMSTIEKKYLAKAVFLFFLGALMNLYAIQQMASGMRLIPIEWTLGLAYAGTLLLIPALFYFLIGITKQVHHSIVSTPYDKVTREEPEEEL